ncbi:EF-hand domain-containing protein [Gemmobacter straminiformis]|uniref:EF-hand domain-containing protein n=2 Tax=Paragemmobacter straminiformis TaxID=2045119 RepID=A0A842IBT8_9RHOB|nr:EF-hand domain-containing protein [Gemmobacter straminiformis]
MGGGEGMGPMAQFDFAAIDADKDGKITQAEMTAWRASQVIGVDADKDGKLSADELKAMHMARMEERAANMATQMIERLDVDGDGLLGVEEMAARPGPAMMFDRIDADGDGAVTQEEVDAARAAMAEMRGQGMGEGRGMGEGMGRGMGAGHGMGEGHGRMRGWFFGNE